MVVGSAHVPSLARGVTQPRLTLPSFLYHSKHRHSSPAPSALPSLRSGSPSSRSTSTRGSLGRSRRPPTPTRWPASRRA
jgi:hypothetical protein